MTETATETGRESGAGVIGGVRRVASFLTTTVRWVVALNAIALWLVFWGNLVRLHVAMGHAPAAFVTAVAFVGPIVLAGGWWSVGEFGWSESTTSTGGPGVST